MVDLIRIYVTMEELKTMDITKYDLEAEIYEWLNVKLETSRMTKKQGLS